MSKPAGSVALLLAVLSGFAIPVYGAGKKAMTPDDLFRLEVLGAVAISPDGRSVAYVLQRPLHSVKQFGFPYLRGNDHADVWMVPSKGGDPQRITDGERDDSGFWGPEWSPDGEWLAVLSTRGGNIRVWVWSRASGRLQMASELGSDLAPDALVWLSNHELVYSVLFDGEKSQGLIHRTQTPEAVARQSSIQREGKVPTASVLESGVPEPAPSKLRSELLLTDVGTGKTTVISKGTSFASLRVSPERRSVAFLRQTGVRGFVASRRVHEFESEIYEAGIASSDRQWVAHFLAGVREPIPGSLLWSHDGTEIALIGYDAVPGGTFHVFRCGVAEGRCHAASNVPLDLNLGSANQADPVPLEWLGNGKLLIYARRPAPEGSPHSEASLRWWINVGDGATEEFLPENKQVPRRLIPDSGGESVVGVVDGNVWRIDSRGVPTENLTLHAPSKLVSIAWPASPQDTVGASLLLRGQSAGELYLLDLRSKELAPFPAPSPPARFADFSPRNRVVAFTGSDNRGSYLWFKGAGQDKYQDVVTNQFLEEIAEGKLKNIQYRGADGQELNGWVILPPDYQEGTRYPLVVWVYQGTTYGIEPPRWLVHVNDPSPLNLQILAARGYAVLLPSMPAADSEAADPFMELTKGVLPAIDRVIDLGIADPDRLGIMGQSFGGYSTYGIIEQTNRFKAAVACAGFSDFISLYGTLDPESRYRPVAQESTAAYMWLAESGQEQMGSPPWKDLGRYLRNSPITYVDRVETPLLIVQGDLDFIPIQQGEEFFDSLYRQNKRARFVRYGGEGHILDSPANIRDMWERVFAWFDEFLQPK
jgi:dipeptidyl aminopeptidase/acylaminoacyl peptidase